MVARPKNLNDDSDDLTNVDVDIEGIHILSEEEAWEFFNDQAQRILGISGEEFLRRWDRGDYRPVPDTPEGWPIAGLVMLMPVGRPQP